MRRFLVPLFFFLVCSGLPRCLENNLLCGKYASFDQTTDLMAGDAEFGRSTLFTLYSLSSRSLNALPITDTELRLIAAAAMMGLRSTPNTGYSAPAAIGIPITL